MGTFSEMTKDIKVDEELKKLQKDIPGFKQIGNNQVPMDQQLIVVEKMAKDQGWLGKMSSFFQNTFRKALQYEQRRQVAVMNEFFQDMKKLGHKSLHLHLKEGEMADHMISYDKSDKWSPLNAQVTIHGNMNKFKAEMGLQAVKKKGFKYITVYLDDPILVEFDNNGQMVDFNKRMQTGGI